jgi:putative lipoic acid-binding regulatory protein
MQINDIQPAEGQGFQFPGEFEITAMGNAAGHLETLVPELLQGVGLTVLHETVSSRQSSGGTYTSVTIRFLCQTREDYDKAHAVLRGHDEIRFTL